MNENSSPAAGKREGLLFWGTAIPVLGTINKAGETLEMDLPSVCPTFSDRKKRLSGLHFTALIPWICVNEQPYGFVD